MGRRPGTTCSVCHRSTTLAATRSDGAGGRRCKIDCAAPIVAASEACPYHEGATLPCGACEVADAADAAARERVESRRRATRASAQVPLPGSEVARTLTLPMPREPLAPTPADERGTCAKCGAALTPENSSRRPIGVVVHVGCPAVVAVAAEGPIELSTPCGGCDASREQACAWATPEPASYVHPCRVRLLAPEERASIATRATEDRIRALCDHWASLPGPYLMPMRGAIVRAITSDGATDALLAVETLAAMIERGEIVEHTAGDVSYYRRAPGSAPVAMGRVGVRAAPVPSAPATIEEALMFAVLEDVVAHGAVVDDEAPAEVAPGMREADRPALTEALADPETAAGAAAILDAMGLPPEVARVDTAHGPVEIAAPDAPLSPAEAVLVELQEIAQALSRARGAAGSLLGLAVRARAAEEMLDGVQRERDEARARADVLDTQNAKLEDLALSLDERIAAAPTPEELALAKDLARVAQLETADRTEEKRALRNALANLYEQHGGTSVPPDAADLIAETAEQIRRRFGDAAVEIEGQRSLAASHASRVLALRAGIVAALAEPPTEPADVGDAELVGMLRPAPLDVAERPTLSKSEVGVLRRCPRRYYYEYEQGRTPASGSGVEAEWGSALHAALEQWLTVQLHEGEPDAALGIALNAIDASGITGYAAAALRAVLRAYVAAWGPSDAEQYEVVGVEVPFDLPVVAAGGEEAKGRREGRIDAIVRRRDDGQVWVTEHKSTGKPPGEDRFYHGLDIELQPSLYFDAARALGYEPAGVLYDVVRRPEFDRPKAAPAPTKSGEPRKAQTRACGDCNGQGHGGTAAEHVGDTCPTCKGTKRVSHDPQYSNPRYGESPAAYEERLFGIITADPAEWFGRRELPIAEWQVEETREDFRAAAEEVAWRRQTGHWPRVGDRYVCAAVKMTCPWIDVCGRRADATDDRLFPLKVKPAEKVCERCGKPGDQCIDPGPRAVYGHEIEVVLCDECYQQSAEDE